MPVEFVNSSAEASLNGINPKGTARLIVSNKKRITFVFTLHHAYASDVFLLTALNIQKMIIPIHSAGKIKKTP